MQKQWIRKISSQWHFKNLYTTDYTYSNEEWESFTLNLKIPKFSDEGPLTYDECKKVLETFQADKAPGEDGFTAEFYMYFFDLLGNNLIASFNEA